MGLSLTGPQGYFIERLNAARHDRGAFSCGETAIDTFLQAHASQAQERSLSATWVLVPDGEAVPQKPIVGYVTLATTFIPILDAPQKLRKLTNKPELPALLLARMGVDRHHQRKRLGDYLVKYAMLQSCALADLSGCAAIIVDAKTEALVEYYQRFGFARFTDANLRLFMMTSVARKLLSDSSQT